MTILDKLADHARERVAAKKARVSLTDLKRRALVLPKGNAPFEKALRKPGLSLICECKKASPSKGLIAPDFPYLDIARDYERAGADALSVLTEPKWFLGADEYLEEIARAVSLGPTPSPCSPSPSGSSGRTNTWKRSPGRCPSPVCGRTLPWTST